MPDLRLWGDRELSRLKSEMQRLFDSLCVDYGLPGSGRAAREIEVSETGDEVTVRLAVSGMEPSELKVEASDMSLSVSGLRVQETEAGRAQTAFSRRVGLPCRVAPDRVQARLRDGVLTVRLPKCPDSACRNIDIIKD